MGVSNDQVKTYLDTDGAHLTKAIYVPGYFPPGPFDVTATVGNTSQTIHFLTAAADMSQ